MIIWPGGKQCDTPKHHSFPTRTMQSYPYMYFFPCRQASSGSHHSDSASDNSTAGIDTTSVSADTRFPVNSDEWTPAVVPIIGNDDSSLTASLNATENFFRMSQASFHRIAGDCTPPIPHCHSSDAHLEPWSSTADVESTHAYTPPTDWDEFNVADMDLNRRSQVPSGSTNTNIFGRTWSHRGDYHHAVEAPAQHTLRCEPDYPSYSIPIATWPYMAAFPDLRPNYRATIGPTTSFDGVSSLMARSVLSQVPSLRHHRHRKARAHPEHVTCDKCQKPMRRQSLRRHIREVHDRIRRHARSHSAAEP